jgi:adenylate cyclase class 2
MASGQRETEIKLPAADAATARRLLRPAGFRVSRRRVFEANTVFDTPDTILRASQRLLRVREAGGVITLTYKGPPAVGRHKSREELELELSAAAPMAAILDRLGFRPVFRYEKYRTEYRQPGRAGVATVDETPVGVFLELEGQPRWIDRTARALGFGEADYITASYGRLYLEWCQRNGVAPGDMLLLQPATRQPATPRPATRRPATRQPATPRPAARPPAAPRPATRHN